MMVDPDKKCKTIDKSKVNGIIVISLVFGMALGMLINMGVVEMNTPVADEKCWFLDYSFKEDNLTFWYSKVLTNEQLDTKLATMARTNRFIRNGSFTLDEAECGKTLEEVYDDFDVNQEFVDDKEVIAK